MSPVSREGALPSTPAAACATASGAMNDVHDPPLGRSTAASSAAAVVTVESALLSRSRAITWIGTVCGSAPVRPATAFSPSEETVPRSCPDAASLYVAAAVPTCSGLLITWKTYASCSSSARRPTPSSECPNSHTRSPSTYTTVPTALVRTSPVEYPTATADPGRNVCAGNVPSGPGGTANTVVPTFCAAATNPWATGALSPLTVSGETIGRALASAAFIRADGLGSGCAAAARLASAAADDLPGTSTGVPMIASIGVASTTLPPYAKTDCEIAPITRITPASPGQ